MQINVVQLSGTVVSFSLASETTVLGLKQQLADLVKVSVICQQLVFGGSILKDSLTLVAAGVPHGGRVTLMVRGRLVLTASLDQSAKLWSPLDGTCLQTYSGHSSALVDAKFSADGAQVLTASEDCCSKLFRTDSGLCLRTVADDNPLITAECSMQAGMVLTGSSEGGVKVWSLDTLALLHTWVSELPLLGGAVPKLSPDEATVLVVCSDCVVRLFSMSSGECLRNFTGHSGVVYEAKFSRDGSSVVTASDDGSVKIWHALSGACLNTIPAGSQTSIVDLSPDNARVLTCDEEMPMFELWSAETSKMLFQFEGHSACVRSAVFSPDGLFVATASNDRSAKIWDIQSSESVHTLVGHEGSVFTVAFSPDSELLLTASEDKVVKVWSVVTGSCLQSLVGHHGPVVTALFSP